MNRTIAYSAAALLTAAALAGCTERKLSERPDDGPLIVNLVWPEETEAEGRAITGTDLYLYASDGTLYKHIECGTERHEERVPADTYIILAVNADCSNAACDEEGDCDECCMRAEDDTDNKGALLHVDKVYCTGTDSVIVKRGNIPTEVTLYPQNVVKYLHFNLDPGYITRIVGMEVRMSGAVPSVYLMDGEDTGDPVRDIMATATEQADGTYEADMSVFGWRGENILTATLTYDDGTQEDTETVDISDELGGLPDEGGEIDVTLTLPDGGEIELTVTVTPWQEGTGSGDVI